MIKGIMSRHRKTIGTFLIAGAMVTFFGTKQNIFAALNISSSPSSVSFETRSVSSQNHEITGQINFVTASDDRGGSPGWTLSMTASHMTTILPARKVHGENDTVTSGGTYDGTFGVSWPIKKYILTITEAGPVGTAKFSVSGAETATNITTGNFVEIGTKGVRASFDLATYAIGDEWMIIIDALPYTGLAVSPGTITVNSGSGTNVTAGETGNLSGNGARSDAKTILQAPSGSGTGSYSLPVGLSLAVHKYCIAGEYIGDIILTLI